MLVVAKSQFDKRWLCRAHRVEKAAPRQLAKADAAEIERLLNEQTRLTPQVRRAFLAAVDRIQSQIDVDHVAMLLRSGRTQEAISQVENIVYKSGYKSVADAVTQAIIASGIAAAASDNAGVDFSFGVTNPHTLQFLHRYEMNLISGLSKDSLASVRSVIADGVAAGRNPLDIARDLRDLIGLTPRQAQAVMNYRSYLEDLDPAALARDLRDARFDSTIQSALDEQSDLSADYIDKVVGRYQDRMLAYRADTIARTEAMRSVNAGNHQLWNQMVNDGKVDADTVVRQWIYTHDGRTRPWHRTVPANNPEGVGLNEPFQTDLGPMMFPGDPDGLPENSINCRCTVVYRTKAQAKELASAGGGLLSSLFGL